MVILVVTHDDTRRGHLTASLRERGYDVVVAPHRQDVSATMRDKQPQVVVLDLYMSNPSPLAILQEMRQEGSHRKVVALGGSSIRSTMGKAMGMGVDQLIGGVSACDGPLDLDQVDSAIRACFADQIRKRAHELWEQQGRPRGRDRENWQEAEREVLRQPTSL
ncbi:hypothetical protein YTPLAS18_37100 [Nitrospira sp.]|nr:hypothetical protein YTPLAS18_37100 [Nitrospira sp.]